MYRILFVGMFCCFVSVYAKGNINSIEQDKEIEEQIFEQLGPLTLLELAPLTKREIVEKLKTDFSVHLKKDPASLFDKYFLSFIYNYFQMMKPDKTQYSLYNLYSLRQPSQQLVSLRGGNNLYFSKNAGDKTITKRFKELLDAFADEPPAFFPDEIIMTFEYNNELYTQMNKAVLSSEDIKAFMKRHSGIVFDESSDETKVFSHEELIMILKQYLDLPVHIRDNLALKRIVRKKKSLKESLFGSIAGEYSHSTETIILNDDTFEAEGQVDEGQRFFLHEIGHALWGKAIWKGLSSEAREDYEKLSWQGDEKINDEFISDYSTTDVQEDFAEHFSAYINNAETLQHKTLGKYDWLKENIFLGTEYFSDTADNLKIFVESDHGDTTPPYFIDFPFKSVEMTISYEDSALDDWPSGRADIKVEVSGLFDDMSGIESMDILMQSEYDYFWMISPDDFKFCNKVSASEFQRDCVLVDPDQPGWYAFYDYEKLSLSYKGYYKVTQIHVKDKAGNEKTLRSHLGDVSVFFPGTRGDRERAEAELAAQERREEQERRARERSARRKQEARERSAEKERKIQEELARRKKSAQEATGWNILNLSDQPVQLYSNESVTTAKPSLFSLPVRLYQRGEKLSMLYSRECVNIAEEELSQLSLTTASGWFDFEWDALICSNTADSEEVPPCDIKKASLIKKNKDYIIADYQYEESADFKQCRLLKAIKEQSVRKKAAKEALGLNLLNLSDGSFRIYQNQKAVLDLKPQKCVNITERELSALSLEAIDISAERESVICTNIKNSSNIYKCDIKKSTLIKQNDNGEYVLKNYKGEKSADFSQCAPLTASESSAVKKEKAPSQSADKENQDQTPPYLIDLIDESVFLSKEEHGGYTFIKVEVKGLFDDLSGIQDISVFMKSKIDDHFSIHSPDNLCEFQRTSGNITALYEKCFFKDSTQQGRYVFYAPELQSYTGNYALNKAEFTDTAGNSKTVESFDDDLDHHNLSFPNKELIFSWGLERSIKKDLEIKTSKTDDGDTIAHIFIADMREFELYDINMSIMDMETEHELKYSIDTDQLFSLNDQFESPVISGKMSLPVVIPKELASGKYKLNWIDFERTRRDDWVIEFDKSNPLVYFDHISSEEDSSLAQPVVDDILMEVVKQDNRRGGDTTITADIPIEGLNKGDGWVKIILKTPTGDFMSVSSELEPNPKGFHSLQALFHLGPNHAEGEYLITQITTSEDYSNALKNRINHRGLSLYKGGYRRQKARLLERGIRTTVKVNPSYPSVED